MIFSDDLERVVAGCGADAAAASEAMREPTGPMMDAIEFFPGAWSARGARANYHAMIDAALEEKA